MGLHRVQRDEQGIGDLLVGIALGNQLEHFPFTPGQQRRRYAVPAAGFARPLRHRRVALEERPLGADQAQLPGHAQDVQQHLPGLSLPIGDVQPFGQDETGFASQ
ncbi:hypothetical protein D9M71_429580 [compost metagenome]